MALAYQWTINQLDAKIHEDGNDNVIYTIHYTYTGIDGKYSANIIGTLDIQYDPCLLYTSPSPRDRQKSRMPSSA